MGWLKRSFLFLILCYSINVYAIDPTLDWFSFETDNFVIHYTKDNTRIAKRAAVYAEKAHQHLAAKFDWQPEDKTHLVISDETDFSNGYATPYFFNRTVLFITQPDHPNSLEDFDDWLELLILHEYTHILHIDKSRGVVSGFRNIFGRHVLLFPNIFQPPWLIEGIATQIETVGHQDKHQGTGRGQSSYFKMMMRMEVAGGVKPVSQVNLPYLSWPVGTSAYLYGVYFYEFLDNVYGEDAATGLIEAYSGNIVPFMINTNARRVLDKDITELWQEYTAWLENEFNPQLNEIRRSGITVSEKIANHGYYTDQVDATDSGDVFYLRHDPFQHVMLMQVMDAGDSKEISEVHASARIDVHNSQRVLIAQPEYCNNYNLNYDLFIYDIEQDKQKRITECGRYRSAAWMPDGQSMIAVHIDGGRNELHLVDSEGNNQGVLWKTDAEVIIGQPDISNDGRYLVASVFRKGHGWNIEQFDIQNKNWVQLTSDKAIDAYPVYINNDESVLFSSERNGVYNIYQLNTENKTLEQLSNVLGGAFKSARVGDDLYYVGYSGNGNDIYKIDNLRPVKIETLQLQQPEHENQLEIINLDIEVEEYSPWRTLRPRWWEPVIVIEEDRHEAGFATTGHDALMRHSYFMSLAYDSENELFTGKFAYNYIDRLILGLSRESTILSDINGDYAATIVEDDYYLYWMNPVTKYESSWNTLIGLQHELDKEHRREPWIPPINEFKSNRVGLAFIFKNTQNYLRAISQTDGRNARFIFETNNILDSDYTGEVYTLDWREFIQVYHQHVLALRAVGGWGTESPENFRLGGEDSDYNLLDILELQSEELFGKREYTLRGYPEGAPQLRGRRMQLASLEWRFPLGLIERSIMAPPIGIIDWSGSVFAETGAAWDEGGSPDKYYSSIGVELHADMNVFYRLNTRLRLGYATGLDEVIGEDRLYFSLGTSF